MIIRIQCAFGEYFLKILQNTWAVINTDKLFYLNSAYYHFPNSVILRFSEQAKIFTVRFLNRYRLDLQNQWNLHIKQKAKKYTDQSYSACVRLVFLIDFTKHVDSKIAPKTRGIIIIDILFYFYNTYM